MSLVFGIDLGGTNLRIAAFGEDLASDSEVPPTPLAELRRAVPGQRDPESIVAFVANTIGELETTLEARADAVGIGFAGMMRDDRGFVSNAPHFGWRNVPFGELLAGSLECPIAIENDVNAIAIAEAQVGAGRGYRDALVVFGGTGIGGAIIANGEIVRGHLGCAGEIGHSKVAFGPSARACHCGKLGCVEAYVGGRCLRERVHLELAGGAWSKAIESAGTIGNIELSDIDAAAAAGDPYAVDLYAEIAPLIGVVLGNAISLLNPGVLILGGGSLSRMPLFREQALVAMQISATNSATDGLNIALACLGDNAGLIGSAILARAASRESRDQNRYETDTDARVFDSSASSLAVIPGPVTLLIS